MSTNRTFNKVQLDVKFTQATSRANLTSEENISISFGKLSKWHEALVPTGGSSGKILAWNTSGTAKWSDPLHPAITLSADTTSTPSQLSPGGSFTAVTSVTREGNGHVTKINTATYTLPNDTSMTQTNTTGSADYRVLLSGNANDTTETTTGRKSTNLKFNPSTGVLSASSGVTTKTITRSALKGMLTGSGTAAQDKGSGVSPRYFPAKWTFNTGLTAANGDVFIIKLPTAGHSYGVFLSIDNGANYYPISVNGTSKLTTHYGNGYSIAVMFKSDGSTADVFPLAGGNSRSTVTGGCWQVLNYYDSGNSNTYDRNRYNANIKAGSSALVAGNIIVGKDGVFNHLKSGGAFDISYPILYLNAAVAASATTTDTYDILHITITTTQSITLTAYKPVFIKGTLSGTIFTPVSATPLTQTVPTTDDGYVYIYLGNATSTTTMYLQERHPIYAYKNGAFGEITNYSANAGSVAWDNVTGKPSTYTPASGSDYYVKNLTGSSRSTATTKSWVSMCNSSQTGAPTLPTSGKWWHVLSLDCWNSAPNNWVSQLALPTQDDSSIYYRKNPSSGTSIESGTWIKVLDSNNYTSYTVKKDGTGATGSWGISITGNAATATKATQDGDGNTISSTYLKLSGGTMTGDIEYAGDGNRKIALGKNSFKYYVASNAGWAGGLSYYSNDGSTGLGYFGAYGQANTLEYHFIGGTYNAPQIKIEPTGPNLIINSEDASTPMITFFRKGSNKADWRIVNTGGNLKFQSDYTTTVGDWYDALTVEYNTGNITMKTNATFTFGKFASASANANRHVFFKDDGANRICVNDNFKYNPSTNILTVGSITGSAATATKLETARNIALADDFAGSADFDGSGNISISGTFYRCSATSNNTANYPWHRIAYRTGVTGVYNDTDAIFMIRAYYNGGPFGIIKVTMRTNGSGANCQVAARWLVRQNIAANDVYIAQWGKTGQSVYADIFLKGTTYNRAYVHQIAGSRLWTLVNSNEASDTTTSDKKTSTEVYASIAAAGTTLHNQAYTQILAGIDEGHVNSANSAATATRADCVNVVAGNEIRFYNNNQFTANNQFWLGYSWAAGSHYTPSGGSDTSSTTAPNITKFIMGNCSAGGLASVHAKTFILGNGSSPTHNSKTTTIATAATTTDRTITLPDASGTIAVFPAARTTGQVVVTDGTAGGIKSSGYTIATSVPSGAKFTDENVTQTNTTTSADYRVLLSGNANDTTETTTVRKSANLKFNPSSGGLYSFGFLWTDITGSTLDINTLTLSNGTLHSRRFIEKTDGGAANITNIPVTGHPFLLEVDLIRWASTTDYITRQRFTNAANGTYSYVRYCTSGTWGSWTTRKYTDTDTKVTSSANHYTPATASGQDKTASASGATAAWSIDVVKGVTLNTDGKGHVTGISVTSGKIPGNPNTDRYVNTASFTDDSTNTAASPVKMTLTRAGSDTATVTANIPKVSSTSAGVAPKGATVSSQSQSTKFLREDGSWAAPTYTSIPSNNVTGSGTSGCLAKWNGTNTITNGPLIGSSTTTYLRNDGSWATPPDTKNTAGSTDTSSKIFLIGATSQAANPQTYSDNEVYTTSGVLTTKKVQVGGGSCTMEYNSTTQSLDFIFT